MSREDFSAVAKSNSKPFQKSNKTRAAASVALNYVSKPDDEQGKCKRNFPRKGVPEHLSKAIQKNIVALVSNMPFNESFIPDELIAEGCITEDECKLAREKNNRKDQVRKILTLVRGRSFPAMEKFLKVIGKESNCPTIVENIWKDYEELNQTNLISEGRCGVCKVKADVDVRYVMDYLWQENAISNSLYEQLCDAKEVKGHQGLLWDNVLKECHENQRLDVLNFALKYKGHYPHIADDFRTQVRLGVSVMKCTCVRQTIPEDMLSIDSLTSCDPLSTGSSPLFSDYRNDTLESDESDSGRVSINRGSANLQRIHTARSQSDRTRLISKDNKPETRLISKDTKPETRLISKDTKPETRLISKDTNPETRLISKDNKPETRLKSKDSKPEREMENIAPSIESDTCFPMFCHLFKGKK